MWNLQRKQDHRRIKFNRVTLKKLYINEFLFNYIEHFVTKLYLQIKYTKLAFIYLKIGALTKTLASSLEYHLL